MKTPIILQTLALALTLAACGETDSGAGSLSSDERQQLERAVDMLESRDDTPSSADNPEEPPAPFESE